MKWLCHQRISEAITGKGRLSIVRHHDQHRNKQGVRPRRHRARFPVRWIWCGILHGARSRLTNIIARVAAYHCSHVRFYFNRPPLSTRVLRLVARAYKNRAWRLVFILFLIVIWFVTTEGIRIKSSSGWISGSLD